jgi:hypothetical protein
MTGGSDVFENQYNIINQKIQTSISDNSEI